VTKTTAFHHALRVAQRLAILGFATAATALADGSGAGTLTFMGSGPAFANDIEATLVRTIVGLKQGGLERAIGQIDKLLERSPNYRLGYMIKGDLLMAAAGRPSAFGASSLVDKQTVAPLQDEARGRVQRDVAAPPVA
jgi:hypothetical protein